MSAIRALLMTDVVDSTRVSEALGETATAALWQAHDRAARDLLGVWRGREIDKSDGLLALFENVDDAVGYALAYHRTLTKLEPPLAARAGIAVGPVILRENSAADIARGAKAFEVEGMVKPMAARVMPIARGGQTLLTARAREALDSADMRTHSHGHWRMKGVAEPIELFEIGEAEAPFTSPEPRAPKAYRVAREGDHWLPVEAVRHSLPAARDAFIDRHRPLLELARRFDEGARLVSILGIGGSGKTRLATHFARSHLGDFPGGAWFCDLSQARSVDGIVHAVATSLDIPLGRDDPVVQLGNAIAAHGPCLAILDNFEQVSRYAEDTLGRWMNRAAQAHFMVTTREVLGLHGETLLPLAPLAPDDAAALFVSRAESAQWDFKPGAEDQAAIPPLVKLLDGLPLAIELAAARVRVMPPRTLLSRMSERFKVLASSGRRHDRQATLRATFDWSWELLAPADKAALAQLSVFEGGFTLAAAEAVLDLSKYVDAPWSIDAVQSLVDKSLVRPIDGQRFELLGTLHDYAAEHLRTTGRYPGSGPRARAAAEERHGVYFAAFDEKRAIDDRCADLENLVAACRRAVTRSDTTTAVGTLEAAWAALQLRGPFRVGVELAASVRAMPQLAPNTIARAERVAAVALHTSGNVVEARAAFDTALAMAREAGDRHCETEVLTELGRLNTNEGRMDAARSDLTLALALAGGLDDKRLLCDAHSRLGELSYHLGDMDASRSHNEAALVASRECGDRRREAGMLGNLGLFFANQGTIAEAEQYIEAAIAVTREVGDRQWEGSALCNLGWLHLMQGNMPRARDHLDASLVVARQLGLTRLEGTVLCNLGMAHDALGQPVEARAHYEATLPVARGLGDRRLEGQTLNYLGLLHARQKRFDDARVCLDASEALLEEISDPVNLAILLCSRAESEYLAGELEAARGQFGRARALALEVGVEAHSELGESLARVNQLLAWPP